MNEVKKKRGRPKETGSKNRRIGLRVTNEQYTFLKELSDLEGESLTDYILESIRIRSNLTKNKSTFEETEPILDDEYVDNFYEDDYIEYD